MSTTEYESLRKSLTPSEFSPFFNHEFWVYLKPIYLDGIRYGLTDCCEVGYECSWHKACKSINSPFSDSIQ